MNPHSDLPEWCWYWPDTVDAARWSEDAETWNVVWGWLVAWATEESATPRPGLVRALLYMPSCPSSEDLTLTATEAVMVPSAVELRARCVRIEREALARSETLSARGAEGSGPEVRSEPRLEPDGSGPPTRTGTDRGAQ